MKRWLASPLLPVAAAVAVLAPFARKAFNVDDPLFLWTARQIARDPADFFGFNVNWYGWEMWGTPKDMHWSASAASYNFV